MELKGQFKKLVDMSIDGKWHCQSEWWPISKSPHKRREDLETKGYFFANRPCEHGIINSRDYMLVERPAAPTKTVAVVTELPNGTVRYETKQVAV